MKEDPPSAALQRNDNQEEEMLEKEARNQIVEDQYYLTRPPRWRD